MTKDEFVEKFGIKYDLMEKYNLVYFIVGDLLNINKVETMLEKYGFKCVRQTENYTVNYNLWSKIYFEDIEIGLIDLQGFPSITFYKRKRKFAKLIQKDELILKPIEGVHRILDWHTVEGNLHCLANGESVLYTIPSELTEELIKDHITKLGLQDIVKLK